MTQRHTKGTWTYQYTGDGKRIIIGKGLVEGPNGYDVAEVYSDDCPRDEAEANARLISAAPDLLAALEAILLQHDDREMTTSRSFNLAREALSKAKEYAA